jgi:hypothetical protein
MTHNTGGKVLLVGDDTETINTWTFLLAQRGIAVKQVRPAREDLHPWNEVLPKPYPHRLDLAVQAAEVAVLTENQRLNYLDFYDIICQLLMVFSIH